jgi:hypothetical protein
MEYQIQNNLGEVVVESVSEEELAALLEGADEYNYFMYEPDPELDLVKKWAEDLEAAHNNRIYKLI